MQRQLESRAGPAMMTAEDNGMIDAKLTGLLEALKGHKKHFMEFARLHPFLWHEMLVPRHVQADEGWWRRFMADIYYDRAILEPDGHSRVLERPADGPGNEEIVVSPLGRCCERYSGDLAARPLFDTLAGRAFDAVRALSVLTDHPTESGLWYCEVCEPGRAGWVDLMYRTARMYPETCCMSIHTFGDLRGERELWRPERAAAAGVRSPGDLGVEIQGSTQYNVFDLSAKVLELWLEPPRPVEIELPVPINLYRLMVLEQGGDQPPEEGVTHPTWDEEARELRWGRIVVKRYSKPPGNQIFLLEEFEKDGWPKVMEDPMPGSHGIDPKKRLGDTVRALNQNMVNPIIEFYRDGTGERICWRKVT